MITNSSRTDASYQGLGVSDDRRLLAFNAVDVDDFAPGEMRTARQRCGLPKIGHWLASSVSSRQYKGHDVLIRAMVDVLRPQPGTCLVVVGDGPLLKRGTLDIIDPEITGIVVPPDDPVPMAAAIVRLLSEPSVRGRMGELGRLRVMRHFERRGRADRIGAAMVRLAGEAGWGEASAR